MKTGIYWQNPAYPAKGMDFVFDPSLVLYLPLYELDGASFMSKDAYGHLCTVTGALWKPNGRYLDGSDDFIDCGNPTALQMVNDFTVEMWIDIDATQGSFHVPIGHGHSGDSGWVWQAGADYNMQALFSDGSSINGPFWGDLRGLRWKHLAAVKSSSAGALVYLDGEVKDTMDSRTADVVLTGNNLHIGQNAPSGRNVKGIIGKVRIYSRALTPLEIQRNYLATKRRYQ